jgi:RNA polymerase sigma-70 factor (ECF subfamily)
MEKYLSEKKNRVIHPVHYMFRMIRNQFVDDCRRKKTWQTESFEEGKSVADIHERTLEEITIERNEVEHLLEKVTVPEKEFLYLWAVEGYTIEEISEIQDVPKNTLLSRLYRLRKKMEFLLKRNRKREAG